MARDYILPWNNFQFWQGIGLYQRRTFLVPSPSVEHFYSTELFEQMTEMVLRKHEEKPY